MKVLFSSAVFTLRVQPNDGSKLQIPPLGNLYWKSSLPTEDQDLVGALTAAEKPSLRGFVGLVEYGMVKMRVKARTVFDLPVLREKVSLMFGSHN